MSLREYVCRETVSVHNGAPGAVDCEHRFSAASVEFEVVPGSGRWTRICMDCAAKALRAGLAALAPAKATYRRVPHAAHYIGAGDRKGHDIEEWDVEAHARPTFHERATAGVPSDAEFHHGYLGDAGEQHWVYTRLAPMTGTCERCADSAGKKVTLRAFRAVGRERDELIQEAWAALSGVALD